MTAVTAPATTRRAATDHRGRPLRTLRLQTLAELRRTFRTPEAVIGMIAMPAILFAMFGLPGAGKALPGGTDVAALLFVSFACYGVLTSALFEMCADLASERRWPWMRRMRATAMPRWAYFAAKVANNVVVNLLIVGTLLALVMVVGGVTFPAGRLAAVLGILVAGTLAFAPMGMALAYWVRPKAATALANVLFLPLSFCSGFFYPLGEVPSVVRDIAPWLPTYHYGQLAWQAAAPKADADLFTGVTLSTDWTGHLLVLGVWVAAAIGLAAWGYARDVDRERGE